MSLTLLILLAPFLYWVLGAGLLAWRTDDALDLAPLLGGAMAGLSCELSYAIGVRPEYVVVPVCVACLGSAVSRLPDRRLATSLAQCFLLYSVALVPIAVSPFPILGTWDGDWLLLMNSGRELFEGAPMTAEALQRPPLFGASVAPLWIVADGLVPFQLFSAVMAGGALGAGVYALKKLRPQTSAFFVLVPLVLSPFFLHNTAACWGKLMAAGLLVVACVDALHSADKRALWWAAVWFALAVAVHQSSIIYAPLIAVCVLVANRGQIVPSLRAVVPFAICGLLLVGMFETWTVFEYGLDAKINSNPAVAQRDPNVPIAVNTLMVMLTSIVAWSPIENLLRWSRNPDALSKARAIAESYWLITSWLQIMAGSFLGAFWPSLVADWRRLLGTLWSASTSRIGIPFSIAIGLVLLLNALLCPFYSSSGSMQTGLVPLALIGFLAIGSGLAAGPPGRWQLAVLLTGVSGTLPWFALNLGSTVGVVLSESFRATLANGSEGDWERLTDNHLTSLGMTTFPYLQVTLAAVACGVTLMARRSRTSKELLVSA